MEKFIGKKILNGIAIGKILFYEKKENVVNRYHVDDTEQEIIRYEKAKTKAIGQLALLHEKAVKDVGEMNARIFEVHSMMLEDDDYTDSVYNIIRNQGLNCEYAVAATGDNFVQMFASMEDEYFQARSADIKDISERLLSILNGNAAEKSQMYEPVILVAKDLAPSETIQMDKSKLLAFVTELGSTNSHTAILARTMGIPAIINVNISKDWSGKTGIVDGTKGLFLIDPDQETLEYYQKKLVEENDKKRLLQQLKGKETITKNGQKINLYANIGHTSDLVSVLKNDAEGIGLFRSEFLYLESDHLPTEEEQFKAYKMVAETMAGKKVIIRTLDLGADKQVDYFPLDKEENPALGYRAIRICLTQKELFKTQLRAIYRASMYGKIAVMYPMIISLDEVLKIREITNEVKNELRRDGIGFREIEEGIMIETPAAALISDILAKEVDFFSIGTNDLTQYTLAIDRQNDKLDQFYNPHHEAIIKLISMVVENAHKEGKWAGICGELGADTTLTRTFLELGVDELSVAPGSILPIREIIRDVE